VGGFSPGGGGGGAPAGGPAETWYLIENREDDLIQKNNPTGPIC
jgi:hypothetical protein